MAEHWAAPGLCEGAAEFLSGCGLPVWLVTNSDTGYVEQAVRQCGIVPAGIVTSEMARCPKPHPGIYQLALELSGLAPDQVVHIGDSLQGDALGPAKLGIRTIWLNTEGRPVPQGVTACRCAGDSARLAAGGKAVKKNASGRIPVGKPPGGICFPVRPEARRPGLFRCKRWWRGRRSCIRFCTPDPLDPD